MSDPADADALLEYLAEHEADCPSCGYNLHALTRPVCPECRQELVLNIGMRHPRFGWFLVAIAPGIFSGIAAALMAIPIIAVPLFVAGAGHAPAFVMVTDLFGWCSGAVALLLLWQRHAFLRLARRVQMVWAISLWVVHLVAFTLLMIRVL